VHQTYEKFRQQFVPMKDKLNAIVPLIQAETAQTPKRDSLINLFNSYKQVLLNETVGFINANPTSVISSFALYAVGPLFAGPQELESKFNALQPAAQKGYFSELIVKSLNDAKVGQIGSMATEFTQNDQNGKPVKLSSFRGKYVLIDFWASWCRPCRQENPNVVAAYNKYKAKNFTVLGVSLDQDKNNWIQAIAADKLTWTHVSDLKYWSNEVAQLYHIQSIPANLLIDPTGRIIGKDLRGEELLQKLANILK
jgi:peroxiredoxin